MTLLNFNKIPAKVHPLANGEVNVRRPSLQSLTEIQQHLQSRGIALSQNAQPNVAQLGGAALIGRTYTSGSVPASDVRPTSDR